MAERLPTTADDPGALAGPTRRLRGELAAAGAILLAVAVLFMGVVTGEQFLWGDFVTWYYPSHEYAAERIRHGSLPLWNPYLDCGMPFMGEADHGTLYPPAMLLVPFAGDRYGLFWALEVFTLLHLWWAGLTTYALLRSLGCGRAPALTGGLVFALGGVFAARAAQVSLVTAQSWLPVVLGGAYHAMGEGPLGPRRGALALAAGLGMMGLCGSPSTLTVTVVGLAVLAMVTTAMRVTGSRGRRAWREVARGLALIAGAGSIGLLIAAAQLVPTLEFVEASERMAYTYDEVASFGVEPDNLIMLIVPRFNGWLAYNEPSYWGSGNFSEVAGYTGLLSLGLVGLALRFRARREVAPWAILALVALWLALGRRGGLHWLLYEYAPPWIGLMRAPGRYLVLWAFGLSVLAGLGLDAALRHREVEFAEVRRWSIILLAALVGVAVMASLVLPAQLQSLEPWKQPWFKAGIAATLLASAAAALGLTVLARARGSRVAVGFLVASAAAAELVIQGRDIGVVPRSEIDHFLQLGDYERLVQRDRGLFRVKDLFGEQSRLMLARLQGVSGPGRHVLNYQHYRARIRSQYSGAFDLLNVKYLVAFEPRTGEGPTPSVLAQSEISLSARRETTLPIDPPLVVRGLDLVSTVAGTWRLASGAPVGEVALLATEGEPRRIPIRFGVETGDVALGGPLTAAREVPVAQGEGVADSLTIRRRHFLFRTEFEPLTLRQVRFKHKGGASKLTIKELYLLPADPATDRWRLIGAQAQDAFTTVNVYENTLAMPRAFLIARYRLARSHGEALDFPHQEGVDPRQEAAIELSPGAGPPPPPSAAANGRATVVAYAPERIVVGATVEGGGAWLVMSEVVFPGWTATVDGREVKVARAQGLFRAVWLEQGSHEVVFEYRPRSFTAGLVMSGLGTIAWMGLAVSGRVRRPGALAP